MIGVGDVQDKKTLVFIPMYNCEKQISRVLKQFESSKITKNLSEIIIIDNGSSDDSIAVASVALKNVSIPAKILKNKENYGLGGSHKVAFNYSLENGFDYVIVLHGDDQGDIRDLIPYLERNEHQHYDSFLGSRFAIGSKLINYSNFRIFGNKVFNAIISFATSRSITDLGSGLNIYKTSYLQDRFYLYFPNNLTFNVYMLLYGAWIKSLFSFFPLTWREEDQISNAKLFSQSVEIMKITFEYMINRDQLFNLKENLFSKIIYGFDIIYESNKEIVKKGDAHNE